MPSNRRMSPAAAALIALFGVVPGSGTVAVAQATENCSLAKELVAEAREYVRSHPDHAESRLRYALEICGHSSAIRYNLAMFLHSQGEREEPLALLEETVAQAPEHAHALNALAFLLLSDPGAAERAAKLAARAVRIDPDNPDYRDTLEKAQVKVSGKAPLSGSAVPVPSESVLGDPVETPPDTAMRRPDAVAVVIGNQHYTNPDVPDVDYASRDAGLVAEYLTRTLGFPRENIIQITNASLTDFNLVFGTAAIPQGKLLNWIVPGASDVFVYYSGHGAPDPKTGRAYFVPYDADPNYLAVGGYSLDLLWKNLGALDLASLTVVVDACFSGNSEHGLLFKNASAGLSRVDADLRGPQGATVMTSGAPNQISSWYPDKKHGLFTYYWLAGVRGDADADGDRRVTVAEMRRYLGDTVPRVAQRIAGREQNPEVHGEGARVLSDLR